jgi:DNA (cytosine-5)-methyltransferase 3A
MRVLSLFDGISCGRVALARADIPVTCYMASEIDKYAIKVSTSNHNDIIHLGDVKIVRKYVELGLLGNVDLLVGGSPCQGFSFAGKAHYFLSM